MDLIIGPARPSAHEPSSFEVKLTVEGGPPIEGVLAERFGPFRKSDPEDMVVLEKLLETLEGMLALREKAWLTASASFSNLYRNVPGYWNWFAGTVSPEEYSSYVATGYSTIPLEEYERRQELLTSYLARAPRTRGHVHRDSLLTQVAVFFYDEHRGEHSVEYRL
jgi:hypothetical protein